MWRVQEKNEGQRNPVTLRVYPPLPSYSSFSLTPKVKRSREGWSVSVKEIPMSRTGDRTEGNEVESSQRSQGEEKGSLNFHMITEGLSQSGTLVLLWDDERNWEGFWDVDQVNKGQSWEWLHLSRGPNFSESDEFQVLVDRGGWII